MFRSRSLHLRRHLAARRTAASVSGGAASSDGGGAAVSEIPTLYSFLQPSIFALRNPLPPPSHPQSKPQSKSKPSPPDPAALESHLRSSLSSLDTDEAWSSFKSLSSLSLLPPPPLADALVSHLSSLPDRHNLKRSFAASIFLLERNPRSLSPHTLSSLFRALAAAATPAPALALARAMFKNRCFPPFSTWGPPLIPLVRTHHALPGFLTVFEENCRICLEEKVDSMKPDRDSCNAVLEGCCRDLGSVSDAERVVEIMSGLGMPPDSWSFGSLAYLYAVNGFESRISELDKLMDALGFADKTLFFRNLISGYVKAGKFESVSSVVLRALRDRGGENCSVLGVESYTEMVKGYIENGRIKDLASLIIEAQELELEQQSVGADGSVGFGIVNACVELGLSDKAHSILDEMSSRGASVGVGVYSSILKAYCKEQRMAEAAQLVAEIATSGLKLDAGSYDSLIDASMSAQDFQSAFSLFREMREARLSDLKASYLTIMTGLMENNRPELMAAFLDTVVDDPRIEIATHDWNSIIHAFCKVGRMDDARRTYRRMAFLRIDANNQTYLSLINGYVSAEKYFSVLLLWTEVKKKGIKFDHAVLDAFLYALVKGGFFDAAMQVAEMAQELKIFLDKWRHKQAFMENHKKLKVAKLRKRNFRKMEALIAFKNWAGLNA